MFLHIEHVPSGETLHLRRLSPTEILDPTALTDRWLETEEFSRDLTDGYIPTGCADYRTEIRHTLKPNPPVIWDGLDWFGSV